MIDSGLHQLLFAGQYTNMKEVDRVSGRSPDEIGLNPEEAGSLAEANGKEKVLARPPSARKRRHRRAPVSEKEWYSKSEAAHYLGVAEITITRYLNKGILHAHRLPTPGSPGGGKKQSQYDYGRLRIHKSELDRYLESVDRHPDVAQGSQTKGRAVDANIGASSAGSAGSAGINVTNPANVNSAPIERVAYEPQPEEEELARLAQGGDTRALEHLRRANLVITREEAALRLGVSWRTIKRYIDSRRLRLAGYFRCPDSYTRAHLFRSDVERLLHSDEPTADVQNPRPPDDGDAS